MDRIESIKNHFEEEAEVFDKTILKLIPHYKYYNFAVYGGCKK